jgi:HSP20 family protein
LRISEFRTGSIERRFKFPNLPRINEEEIKAKYANGLLNIKIPKVKDEEGESRPKIRKVTIEEVPDEELIYEEAGGVI